jgi:DtxR family transcriptional regulator, Mn-dependent transcriptional regulator
VGISKKRLIQLTPTGLRVACDLVRSHRLVERLLTDMLHMPWEKVHDEAEKLEHAISPELETRLMELFGRNGTCPHGSAFTPALPHRRGSRCFPLTDAPENALLRVVRIAELHEREKDFVNSLAAVRLVPGSNLTLLRKAFDGVLELRVCERKATFSSQSGSMIWVENAPEG